MLKKNIIKKVSAVMTGWMLLIHLAPLSLAAEEVTVPAGTVVMVELTERLSPSTKGVGDSISLRVISDVIVDGKRVITAGSPAIGQVTVSRKRGIVGSPASIAFSVISVTTADGKAVPVRATRSAEGKSRLVASLAITLICCIFGLFIHGGDAVIQDGAQIQVFTLSPVTVNR